MAENSGGLNSVLALILWALLAVVIGAFFLGGIPDMEDRQSSLPTSKGRVEELRGALFFRTSLSV